MNKPNIRVIYSFARSGGTLINKLIGVNENVIVLSEVNPSGSYKDISIQARDWFKLINDKQAKVLDTLGYIDKIKFLTEQANLNDKILVVRDWPTINFIDSISSFNPTASGLLEQQLYLEKDFSILPIVVCRRSYAIFRSMIRVFPSLRNITHKTFLEAYSKYVTYVKNFQIIRLEDLCDHPFDKLTSVHNILKIDVADINVLINSFSSYDKCTGNNTLPKPTQSSVQAEIFYKTDFNVRKSDEPYYHEFQKIDKVLGYE